MEDLHTARCGARQSALGRGLARTVRAATALRSNSRSRSARGESRPSRRSNAPAEKQAYLQIGIGASTVWLNGTKIHDQGNAWTGFHAGKERIAVKLRTGVNRLVVEIDGPHFFMGVSDELTWEGQLPESLVRPSQPPLVNQ